MKLLAFLSLLSLSRMPPTRGHDLKLLMAFYSILCNLMPPTRGHDLKLLLLKKLLRML